MSEQSATAYSTEAIEQIVSAVAFNDDGLIAVIAQQHDTGEVLMMAWMNADALRETLSTGRVCYWSRSRAALWRKGETSGQVQKLIDLRWDCDADTILAQGEQSGVACHTGRRSCFFNAVRNNKLASIAPVEINPATLYGPKDDA